MLPLLASGREGISEVREAGVKAEDVEGLRHGAGWGRGGKAGVGMRLRMEMVLGDRWGVE